MKDNKTTNARCRLLHLGLKRGDARGGALLEVARARVELRGELNGPRLRGEKRRRHIRDAVIESSEGRVERLCRVVRRCRVRRLGCREA